MVLRQSAVLQSLNSESFSPINISTVEESYTSHNHVTQNDSPESNYIAVLAN